MNKKIGLSSAVVALGLIVLMGNNVLPAFAENGKGLGLGLKMKAVAQQNKDERKEDKDRKSPAAQTATVAIDGKGEVRLADAKVTAVSTGTITLAVNWGSLTMPWTAQVDANTKVKAGGDASSLAAIAVGDMVNIQGRLISTSPSMTVQAGMVVNQAAKAKLGSFFGTVTGTTSSTQSFTMTTEEKGVQTVYVSASTKITKEGMAVVAFGDIRVGDRVSVGGLWNNTQSTVQADRIKIFLNPRVLQTTFVGTLRSVASSTLPTQITITAQNNLVQSVNINSDTAILDRNWAKASLQSFAVNDQIRVYGAIEGSTITATVVRNVSLPR